MSDPRNCDFCGKPVGFYGCPTHGVDCYDDSDEDPNRKVIGMDKPPLLPDGRCRVCLSYGYCYVPDRCPKTEPQRKVIG